METQKMDMIERMYQLLLTCPDPNKREGAGGWTVKEVVGHLIDSVSNNHQRLLRFTADKEFHFPGYDQETFVQRAGYRDFEFKTLLSLWYAHNKLFLHIVNNLSKEHLGCMIRIGDQSAVTIAQLIDDYYAHMEKHEQQIKTIIAA